MGMIVVPDEIPKIVHNICGEGGIRTLGPVLPGQHISSVPLSTTQAPLRDTENCIILSFFLLDRIDVMY